MIIDIPIILHITIWHIAQSNGLAVTGHFPKVDLIEVNDSEE